MNKLLPLIFLSLIVAVPFAAAQFYYGYFNPSDLLDNPWFIFVAFFAVFFGVIYTSLGKVIGGTAPALVISAAIALVISAGMQRNWYFLQQPIMFWGGILIALLVVIIIYRLFQGQINLKGILLLLVVFVGIWPFIKSTLPFDFFARLPVGVIEFLDSFSPLALILMIIYFVIVLFRIFFGTGGGIGETIREGTRAYAFNKEAALQRAKAKAFEAERRRIEAERR